MINFLSGRTTPKGGDLPYEITDFKVRETDSPMDLNLMPGGNRDVKQTSVKSLTQSFLIRKKIYRPVIVDENSLVLDGQHRVSAAKHLSKFNRNGNSINVKVPYIVVDGYGLEQVRALNMNQKTLSKSDYIDIHADQGIESYIKLKNFIEEGDYKLPLFDIIKICKIDPSEKYVNGTIKFPRLAYGEVENGEFIHGDLNYATQVLDWHQDFIDLGIIKVKNNLSKLMIKMYLLSRDIFDPERFYNNFKKCSEVARLPLLKDADLIEAVDTIYNFNFNQANRIDLAFELS